MNRDELVERVAEAIIPHFFDNDGLAPEIVTKRKDFARERARAALAIIEPAVREDERGRCAALVKGWVPWRSDINPPLAAAIRAGAKP